MTVWTRLKDLVDRVAGNDKPARNFHEDELRLAAAALLVRASAIDGHVDLVGAADAQGAVAGPLRA